MRDRLAALVPASNDDFSLWLSVQAVAEAVDELIVLDDCSVDRTHDVLEELGRRYENLVVRKTDKPLGWTEGRRELMEMTDARHLLFIDADDVFCEWKAEQLRAIVDSPAAHVKLGLAEMWGDVRHGTGRGIRRPHHDPCHCYLDRAACTRALWKHNNTFTYLATDAPAKHGGEVLFWHAKGLKSDWRLVCREHVRRWIRAGRPVPLDQFAAAALAPDDLHRKAVHRLLHDKIDHIKPLPPDVRVPRVCTENDRFEMVARDGRLVDRLDHGWRFDPAGGD